MGTREVVNLLGRKDELVQKFVTENLSVVECADYFGCGPGSVLNALKKLNIKKSPEQVVENRRKAYQRAAVTREQTNLLKYGVKNVYQSEEKKQKIKQVKMARYGNESWTNPEKTKQT